jgi:hypothetical protein
MSHRGAHPEDAALFAPERLPMLREAAADQAWLLSRGYPLAASLVLVGNRFALDARQRMALQRSCASAAELASRRARAWTREDVRGQVLHIDGFNVLVGLEVALGGGVVLRGADGCIRDLAGLRGSYHVVDETQPALEGLMRVLTALAPARCEVLLDAPVSNSGRVKSLWLARAETASFPCTVELVPDPDPLLLQRTGVATSDGMILDGCGQWANLAGWALHDLVPGAWVVDLS